MKAIEQYSRVVLFITFTLYKVVVTLCGIFHYFLNTSVRQSEKSVKISFHPRAQTELIAFQQFNSSANSFSIKRF